MPDFLDSQHRCETGRTPRPISARLEAFAVCLDQETEPFRQDGGLGVIPPDFLLDMAIAQIGQLRATPADKSTLVGRWTGAPMS